MAAVNQEQEFFPLAASLPPLSPWPLAARPGDRRCPSKSAARKSGSRKGRAAIACSTWTRTRPRHAAGERTGGRPDAARDDRLPRGHARPVRGAAARRVRQTGSGGAGGKEETIERELRLLLRRLEVLQRRADQKDAGAEGAADRDDGGGEIRRARSAARAANLLERIVGDFERCGVVGEIRTSRWAIWPPSRGCCPHRWPWSCSPLLRPAKAR